MGEISELLSALKSEIQERDDRDTINKGLRAKETREQVQKLIEKGHPGGVYFYADSIRTEGSSEPLVVEKPPFILEFKRYVGANPYEVRDDFGQVVLTIQPNELLILPHVSILPSELEESASLTRARYFKSAFTNLMGQYTQDPTLESYNPCFLGLSHLAPFFTSLQEKSTRKGRAVQLVWSVEDVPQFLLDYTAKGNQQLIKQFGGDREVTPEDLGFICFRPTEVLDL